MSLRRRILALRWLLWSTVAAFALLAYLRRDHAMFTAVPLVGALVWMAVGRAGRFVANRAFGRFARLVEAERYVPAREVLRQLRGLYPSSRQVQEQLRIYEASLLQAQGLHAETATLLDSIDRRALGERWLPWLLNNLAWALAESGDGARALVVAEESMAAQAEAAPSLSDPDLRACQLGTLGAARVVAGEPGAAIAPLEQALARGGRPRQQSARAFYLGEALHALGRADEAAAAWQRALDAMPEGTFAKRSAVRLGAHHPYRGTR